jgi:MvaI/BcnI restriction endonuclease family
MRQLSEIETARVQALTENGVDLTLMEPTSIGLAKSILDATGLVRLYLETKHIHDYAAQKQGPDHKQLMKAYLVSPHLLLPSMASLYRPQTKKGDPRIWFTELGTYANPNDILAIIAFGNELYVVNISQLDITDLLALGSRHPFAELVAEIKRKAHQVADELASLLRKIAGQGPVPALLEADTAVGRTLEHLLGIRPNSSKQPDYKGIELKSFRDKRANRKTLFAQVPDWTLSKCKSSAEVLQIFGYQRLGEVKLYCTVSTKTRNSQGLMLWLDTPNAELHENSARTEVGDFLVWPLDLLHRRLLEKHNETFWIAADPIQIGGKEHFIYKQAEHTKKPMVSQFDILLDQGIITVDHLIKKKATGAVSEKGPLFKINPNALGLLFPPSETYFFVS